MKNLILPLLLILFFTSNSYGQNVFEKQGAGVTVIVHGWDPDGNQPAWMTEMANAIVARNGGVGHVASITVTGTQGSLTATCSNWTFNLASQNHAEIVVLVNWTAVANHLNTGITAQEVAAAVAPKIYNAQEGEAALAELPIHLIGHSRGGGMVFEIARLLGLKGIEVEHLTALDPHPLTAADPQPLIGTDVIDTPIQLYENILFADVYYQNIESPKGEYVNGAYNRLWTSMPGGYHNETGYTYTIGTTNYNFSDHLNIILAYHGTIDLATPTSNGEATMTQTERDNWFNAYESAGENTGFKYSRQIMGNRKSTDTPVAGEVAIIDGFHNNALLGGNGAREPLDWTNAVWPNTITAELEKGGVIQPKGQMVVTADDEISINFTCRSYANDVDVTFYVDTDRNPYNNNNFSTIGTSNISSTGSAINKASQIWTVGELNTGTRYYLYAEITDNTNKRFFYLPNELSIENETSPIPDVDPLPDITAECEVTQLDAPTATNNTSQTITGTHDANLPITAQGATIITWTYDDGNGNTTTQQQKVILEDITVPTITCPENQTVNLSESKTFYTVQGTEFDPVEAIDNCTVSDITNDFNNFQTLDGAELSEGTTTITWSATDNAGNQNSCNFDVTINVATKISLPDADNISVFPNPVKEVLNIFIKGNKGKVVIADLTGSIVLQRTIDDKKAAVDMSGLNAGIYIVKVTSEDKTTVMKVIKE